MPTLDDVRAQYPQLAELDDNDAVDVLHSTFYRDLSREQVAGALGVKPPTAPKLKRTWGEAATDTARSLTSGVVGLAKSAGDLYGLAAGDMGNPVSRIAGGMQETIADEQSPALKEKRADRKTRIEAADGELAKFGTAFKETVTDPALMADTIASNLATMVPGMAAGRLVMGAGAAARGTMTEAAALLAAEKAAKVATGTAVGVGALQQGADVSSQAYEDSIKKTAAQLAQNPVFVARVQAGEAPREVAMSLGLDAARAAFLPAVAISVVANTFTPGGTMLERALIGGAAKDTIKAGTKYAMPKAMLKAGLGEAAQETVEEGGGQFAANVAKKRFVDPNQDLGQDVGENAGMGAAGGLGLGVPGGMMHREHTPAALPLLPPNGPMARAVNRGIVAEAGMPPPAAPPAPVVLAPEVEADLLAHANARAAEIDLKAKGKKGQKATDQNGKPVTTPDQQPEFLTPQEKAERDFLTEHGGDVQALSQAYPGMVDEPAAPAPAADDAIADTLGGNSAAKPVPAPEPEPAAPPAPAAEAPKPAELPVAPDAAPKPAEAPAYAEPAADAATEPADPGQPIEIDGKKWRAKARPGGGYLLTDGAGGTRAVAGTAKAAQRIADLLAGTAAPAESKAGEPVQADSGRAAPAPAAPAPTSATDALVEKAPKPTTEGKNAPAPQPVPVETPRVEAPAPYAAAPAAAAVPAARPANLEADGLKAVPALPAEPSQTPATKNQGGAATAQTINASSKSETVGGQPSAATLKPAARAVSAADQAVDRADAMGLKGADRKDAVAQDLAQAWGMTVDEVRDADEFKSAVSKPPSKAARTKATERFVEGVAQQAQQAQQEAVAQAAPPAPAAPKPRRVTPAEAKAHAAREAKRSDYFMPGNVVQAYGGADRVISYTPPTAEGGRWSVKVQRVIHSGAGEDYVPAKDRSGRDEEPRSHATEPDAKALAAGPLRRAAPQATVKESLSVAAAAEPAAAAATSGAVGAYGPGADRDAVKRFVAGMADEKVRQFFFGPRPSTHGDQWAPSVFKAVKDQLYGGKYTHAVLFKTTRRGKAEYESGNGYGNSAQEAWADAIANIRNTGQAPMPATTAERALILASAAPAATPDIPPPATKGNADKPGPAKPEGAPLATVKESLTVDPDTAAKAKALTDLNDALGDLAGIFGKDFKANMLPEQEQKLMPVLTRVMDAAFRAGYYSFKQAARFVLDTIRARIGAEVADSISLDHLQGAYIGMAGKYKDQGATPKKEVVNVESLDELAEPKPAQTDSSPAAAPAQAQNAAKENPNERTDLPSDGQKALGQVAAEESGGIEGVGAPGSSAADGRPAGAGESAGTDAAGLPGDRSGRGGEVGVHPAEAGTGRRDRAVGKQGTRRSGKPVPKDDGQSALGLNPAPENTPNIPAQNFSITPELRLGRGGEVEKFTDNLAAIRALKQIESEQRRATPAEQNLLARYVGWGGLANVFPDPISGEFKEKWKARGEELRELLTPSEYTAARRSTRNAHYTSEGVVSAMWSAARRLGYRGGLTLESSMGAGNFLGLAPEGVPAKFIGIEYDSLTARIAGLLYPQAAVLHSAFQKVPLANGAFTLNIGNPPFGKESLRFQYKPELSGVSIHNQFFRAGLDAVRPGGLQIMVVSRFLMDKQDKSDRLALARKGKLVAAIRLPDTAFKENARTEVVTDIVILQRHDAAGEARANGIIDAYLLPKQKDASAERERWLLADQIPAWVETGQVRDPLGNGDMMVNRYFQANPKQVMGVMERSGSMQMARDESEGPDITVRLDDAKELDGMLADAVARLPEGISNFSDEVLATTEARFKMLGDALRIAVANEEPGHIKFDEDGKLSRVIDREYPEGGEVMSRQAITADSPWSESLSVDSEGRWYKLEVQTDAEGKPVKVMKGDKATNRNVYTRSVYATEAEVPAGLKLGQAGFDRLTGIVKLRDLLKRQLVLETEDAAPAQMDGNRKKLAAAYASFVDSFGPVNRPANLSLAMTMPDGGLVAALEVHYDSARDKKQADKSGLPEQAEKAVSAPILRERVVPKYEPATSAATSADALAITLAERGRVDMERIAELRGIMMEQATAELQPEGKPLVFFDPESNDWQTADSYLSGLVKRKLNAARGAGLTSNIAALEKVQPETWTAENVTAQLGATWVPPEVYAAFAEHLVGGKARVSFSPLTNSYSLSITDVERAKAEQWSAEGAGHQYILSRLMNSQAVVVAYPDENRTMRVHQEHTTLAILKGKEIVNEFGDWVFKDGERRAQLVGIFNEKFNTRVNRQFDGSHLTMPGKVPDTVIGLRRHQMNAVWRGISSQFLLLDHVVGSGKTFTGIARAMERRRMGLARKPTIMVPNHLVEQWAADVYRLYPAARVLAAGQKDFEPKRRRRLFGKIATGDWDIVIVPHSSFGFIGIAPETEQRFLEAEMKEAQQAIKDAWKQAEEDGLESGRRKPFGVKEAERLAENLQKRMDKISAGTRDRLLTFEQLGIDDLTVDEAHEFKNLYYSSRLTGVRGMGNKTGSRKAADLYNKVRVLREGGGAVTFMTGTPVSNSAVELFTMMRYLAADELAGQGLTHFDAWRTQYVEATPAFEPTESGRLKEVTRLGRTWSNMRSLMDSYYQFTDAVSNDDIKKWYAEDNGGAQFPVPKVKGGERQLVKMAPTKAQSDLLAQTMADFDSLPGIKDPFERNKARLRLMDRARKLSLDIRAVDPRSNSTEANGKLEVLSRNIKRIYDKWTPDLGTQAVFLDRSVPKAKGDDKIIREYDDLVARRDKAAREGDEAAFQEANDALEPYDANEIAELRNAQAGGWNAYQQIKDNLVAMGIPAKEIRFMQEATNDDQKQAMFDAVNGGKVRILIGSTPRMGAGTNIQQRLVALHHADVTWKPSDIEQREGRIIRQGNKLLEKLGQDFEVEILAYATERTVDAKMWDLNATKLRTINGLRNYDGAFSMDIEDEESVSMAEMAALASGNPLLLERVKLESQINLLELQEKAHRRKMYGATDALERARQAIDENPAAILKAEARAESFGKLASGLKERAAARRVTVEGQDFDSAPAAHKAALEAITLQQAGNENARYALTIDGQRVTNKEAVADAIGAALGDFVPFAVKIGSQDFTQRTPAGRAAAALLDGATRKVKAEGHQEVELGTMFGYQLVADLDEARWNKGMVSLNLTLLDGQRTVASVQGSDVDPNIKVQTAAMRDLLGHLSSAIEDGASNTRTDDLRGQMERAARDLPELEKRVGEAWPKAAELGAKRARLIAVVGELANGAPAAVAPDASTNLAQTGAPEANEADVVFSRGTPTSGMDVATLTTQVKAITSGWANAPKGGVHVVATGRDVPVRVRSADSGGEARAWFDPGTEAVYLVADRLGSPEEAQFALFHEVYGHFGLRSILGADYTETLTRLRRANNSLAAQASFWFMRYGQAEIDARVASGMDPTAAAREVRLLSTEEALADRAGEAPKVSGLKALLARVQKALRSIGLDAVADWMENHTDAEVLDLLVRARSAVQQGGRVHALTGPAGPMVASRANTLDTLRDGDWRQAATDAVQDAMRSQRTFNSWWHRSVGTQYHKAQVDPVHFAPVYHAGQDYLHDTSALANDAAALAPDFLPQLKTLSDLKRLAYKQSDRDAVVAPIFQGTLAGKVYSDEQLRDEFKATPQKIKLYREFRASTDRSLDTLVASDVARYLDVVKDEAGRPILSKGTRALVAAGDVGRFEGLAMAAIQRHLDAAQGTLESKRWAGTKKAVEDKYAKAEGLKAAGYAPLMRFGQYTLTQRDEAGTVTYFSMFENESDANAMARSMAGDPGHTLEQGVMSQDAFKRFNGMTPETMGLFAELAGVDENEAIQQYLRLAVANRSALKRMIHRKGTAGYSEDVSRVLSSFITSNARGASGNLHLGEMSRAVAAIPKAKGDVIDEAQRLQAYITDPQEEAPALRGLMFVNFIGGSVASALTNMTQPITTTLPWLSQFSSPVAATKRIAEAMVIAAKGTSDPKLKAALKRAEDEGTVSPQEIHQLQAETSRGFGNNRGVRAALFVWGSLFSLAEQANRRISFIAAYNTALANKHADPFTFAADAVDATQFVYNKGNRPNWARGAVGATLFTFKQFSISYLEMFKRLPTRERALALAILMLAAGAQGLPFADDLDDLVDSIGQGLGYDWNSKQAKTRFLAEHLGQGGADFVLRGLSAIPGFPLDVAGRMSLGNLIPASGVFLKSKQDKGQEIAEALGPVGGLAQNIGKGMRGDVGSMLPTAIQNLAKMVDMLQTGMYRDGKGRKVMNTDTTDAVMKGIGFQPAEIARESRKVSIGMQQIQLAKATQAEVISAWAQGIFEQDQAKVEKAQQKLRDWNEKNPESRISVSRPAIVAQVRAMNMTRQDRFIKAAPKSMRATILAGVE